MSLRNEAASRAVIRRRLAAPREHVFRAWTEAEHLRRWFFPTVSGEAILHAEVDLRVGGRYRIALRTPEGDLAAMIGGTYYEVQPPTKLVFSWAWEAPEPDASETLVTVELHDIQGETDLVIIHEQFPDPASGETRTIGWVCALERLTRLITAGAPSPLLVGQGDPCRQ
jgi:uncharacterized protein YndB with AHSA1/START domain